MDKETFSKKHGSTKVRSHISKENLFQLLESEEFLLIGESTKVRPSPVNSKVMVELFWITKMSFKVNSITVSQLVQMN